MAALHCSVVYQRPIPFTQIGESGETTINAAEGSVYDAKGSRNLEEYFALLRQERQMQRAVTAPPKVIPERRPPAQRSKPVAESLPTVSKSLIPVPARVMKAKEPDALAATPTKGNPAITDSEYVTAEPKKPSPPLGKFAAKPSKRSIRQWLRDVIRRKPKE